MIDPIRTGRRIARLRREKGYTQAQLAGLLDVSREVVARWETGRGRFSPNTQMLLRLSALFGVSLEELLAGGPDDDIDDTEGGIQP